MLQDKGSFLGVYLNEGAILLGKLDVRFAIYTTLGQLFPPFPHQIITQGMLFETCILDINSPTRNSQTGESAPGEDKSIDAPFSYGTPIFADEILKMKMDPVKLGFYKWLAEHDRNP